MLKIYDTECEDCGQQIEQWLESHEELKRCPVCNGVTHRIYTTMNYKLLYNPKKDRVSWGDFGYATSQYWSKVKEMRDEGHNVKGIEED